MELLECWPCHCEITPHVQNGRICGVALVGSGRGHGQGILMHVSKGWPIWSDQTEELR